MTTAAGLIIPGLLAAALSMHADQKSDDLVAALNQPVLRPGTAEEEYRAYLDRRVPALNLPATAGRCAEASLNMRRRFLKEIVFRGVPAAWISGRSRVEWVDRLPGRGGYSIRKLRYEAVPGLCIPALLYEPEALSRRVPAILNLNGHVGLPGKAIEYEQIRCINLAKRGMLALHPEWLNCGELWDPEYQHNRLAYLDLCGRSGLAVFYLAMRRGLDVLSDHPHADRDRLAVTGLSGGGWQTIWLSALDTRVAACAPNAGYIGLPERARNAGDVGDLEQNPADMLTIGDYPCLTAMLAPRPALLIYNWNDECCFQTARARPAVYEPGVPFYDLFGRAHDFRFHNNTNPGTHNYDQDNREQFYRFVNEVFHPGGERRDGEIAARDEILPVEALRVGVHPPARAGHGDGGRKGANATFGTLAEALLPALPHSRWPAGDLAARRWQARSRRKLQVILRYRSLGVATSLSAVQEHGDRDLPGVSTVRRTLRAGEWSLPLVELRRGETAGSAVVVTEGNRGATAGLAQSLLDRRLRVLVVDLALCGECSPPPVPRALRAMMLGSVGERLLGIQVAQLLAVRGWAATEFRDGRLTLAGVGRVGAVVATVAAALGKPRVEELLADGLPASLKLLIEERVEYDDCPELFCFGLLEQFDIRELLAMAAARKVTLLRVAGGEPRVQEELGPLIAFKSRLGAEVKGVAE
jgi:dienelactone hydrolase